LQKVFGQQAGIDRTEGIESVASEDQGAAAQPTENNRKCNAENSLILIVNA
jgi:hypothetical protein